MTCFRMKKEHSVALKYLLVKYYEVTVVESKNKRQVIIL